MKLCHRILLLTEYELFDAKPDQSDSHVLSTDFVVVIFYGGIFQLVPEWLSLFFRAIWMRCVCVEEQNTNGIYEWL